MNYETVGKCYKIKIIQPDEKVVSFDVNHSGKIVELLEKCFDWFNGGSGHECALFTNMRSLSVNDVVIVNDVYYQCVNIGWNQISEQEFLEIEKAVATHPLRLSRQGGASIALNRVMWDRNMATA